jgi:YHS domain-containing protein
MIGWVLRLLLLIIVIRLIWRFLAGIIDGLTPPDQRASGSRSANGKNGKQSVALVRDPVCGTYVVRANALTLDARGETLYFCSTRCRDEYARRGTGTRPLREAK